MPFRLYNFSTHLQDDIQTTDNKRFININNRLYFSHFEIISPKKGICEAVFVGYTRTHTPSVRATLNKLLPGEWYIPKPALFGISRVAGIFSLLYACLFAAAYHFYPGG
ncbi:hypothetical protein [Hymenobacter busanensis]|uniref:hypothetical protein n=1 Tax=Hymenobacter busanensis TaxID=2607656 RepID=UPI0013670068|nr:hypothetical protein [Hymenobacter busanensis]QHJ08028.1 hypothetical protein GUY19_12335 [Hymenobacter busanensis]